MLIVLVILAAVLAAPAAVNLLRRPDLRRIAVRNIVRRPVESALVVVGSALGTALIVAALMVGDTFDHSIRDIARTDLGEVDLVYEFDDTSGLASGVAAVERADVEGVDGVLAVRWGWVAAAGSGEGDARAVEPSVRVTALDFESAQAFGGDPAAHGLRGLTSTPGVGEIVVNADLAEDLEVQTGDDISLFAAGDELRLVVVDVIDAVGLGGYGDAFLPLETMAAVDPVGAVTVEQVLVSANGGVYDSVDAAWEVDRELYPIVARAVPGFEGFAVKADLLQDAEDEGAEFTQIFSVVGGFSVLAGVLLLINLFVMLAEERKPNLGVLRAIGWKRSTLRRAFRAEGVVYAVTAAVAGTLLGIGVGWVVVQVTKNVLGSSFPDSDFELQLAIRGGSLLTAALIGLVIAMASIAFTSWRISRLNIISAIRDLPEPKTRRSRLLVVGAGVATTLLGALMLAAGLAGENAYLAIVGVPIAAFGLALAVRDVLPSMTVAAMAGIVTVGWGMAFFPLMPATMTRDVEIPFFFLFGVVIVTGGVAISTVLGPVLQRLLGRGNRPMVEARVAMAYPTARLFRTAASLAMYGLIIFTLAFMAIISHSFSLQSDDIATSTAAGHDILVDTNRSNPVAGADLLALDGVTAVNQLVRGDARFSAAFEPSTIQFPEDWNFTGLEPDFSDIGAPTLRERDERFATDQAALAAVASDPTLIVVPSWFLGDEDGFEPELGTSVTAATGADRLEFEIVGVSENDYAWSGAWMSAEAARRLDPLAQPTRTYVQVAADADAADLAETIEARFLPNGAEAETFTSRVQRFIAADQGFFSLLRGYLLLGLVIGIAGLGVSLFRAVRERRRQIGMMRAMGLLSSGVRRWFMTEATFISVMGIVSGSLLGLLTGYLVMTRSTAFDDVALPFGIPWGVFAFITIVPFVASALAAVVPARRAARLRPSEALRLAD